MASLRTEALVLRIAELGESDRIVRLLTPKLARVSAVAKGAKRSVRRFAGTLDLFNHLEVQLEPRPRSSLLRLDQARLRHPYLALRENSARYALASFLVELVDRLAPEGESGEAKSLFEFLVQALRWLEVGRPDARLRVLLELRALALLGFRPELERCARCGGELPEAARIAFDVREGGALCARCARASEGMLEVQRGTLRVLAQGLRWPLERIDRLLLGPAALAEARQLTLRFQRFHLGLELRSEPFLERTLAGPHHPPGREGSAGSKPAVAR